MALTHDIDIYTNACLKQSANVGAAFYGTSTAGYYWNDLNAGEAFPVKVRIGLGTVSGTYTIFTNVFSGTAYGGFNQYWTGINLFQAGGLSCPVLYYYRAQISDDDGATWTDSVDAEGSFTTSSCPAEPIPAPAPAWTLSTTTGTAPLIITFTDASPGLPTAGLPQGWEWDFGSGIESYVQNPVKSFSAAGSYTVTMTGYNLSGSASSTSYPNFTVLSGAPTAAFTANTTTGVRPLTVTFTDGSTNTPTSWSWAFGNGDFSTLQSPTQIYPLAGTYTVTETATNALGSDSEVKSGYITVLPIPAGATFTATPTSGPAPLVVQFFGAPSGDTQSVAWNFGDGSTTTAAGNPLHTYYGNNTYSVTYTVTGVTGASTSTATRNLYINAQAIDNTYRAFLDEIRRQLLMNTDETSVCDDFVEFGGVSTVLRYIYNRVCRLQLEAGLLRKTSTTIDYASPGGVPPGVLALPADLIEIRSIYVNGVRLEPVDPRMADLIVDTWQTSPTGDYKGWYLEPGDPLTLHLVPAINPTTFECYYVYAPAEPTVPALCDTFADFPLPFVFWWIIKYGVLADLLGNEGEMYDIKRAEECEQLFQEGVALAKLALEGD